MENLSLEGTPKTPTVNFNKETGILEIKGRSIPENSIEFYKPLLDWIGDYGGSAKPETQINIKLEYFNTSSSKCILDVFKKLESVGTLPEQRVPSANGILPECPVRHEEPFQLPPHGDRPEERS